MAAFNLCQRSTVAVNHGLYYVDVTASATTQNSFNKFYPDPGRPVHRNIFIGGKTYDFFHVYAKPATEQTFKMYVGPGFNPMTDVKLIRGKFPGAPFKITPGTDCAHSSPTLKCEYDGSSILTVTLDHSAFAGAYASAAQEHCVPQEFCTWDTVATKCVGKTGVFTNLTQDERNITCSYAGKDVDCPTGGCVGFSVKFPDKFVASDQTTANNSTLVKGLAMCFPKDANWNVTPIAAPSGLAGTCVNAPINKTGDFCASRASASGD